MKRNLDPYIKYPNYYTFDKPCIHYLLQREMIETVTNVISRPCQTIILDSNNHLSRLKYVSCEYVSLYDMRWSSRLNQPFIGYKYSHLTGEWVDTKSYGTIIKGHIMNV